MGTVTWLASRRVLRLQTLPKWSIYFRVLTSLGEEVIRMIFQYLIQTCSTYSLGDIRSGTIWRTRGQADSILFKFQGKKRDGDKMYKIFRLHVYK